MPSPLTIPDLKTLTYEQLCELEGRVTAARKSMGAMLDQMLATLQGPATKAATPVKAIPAKAPQVAAAQAAQPTANGSHKATAKRRSPMKGKRAPIKYRYGQDTWSGRGKTPAWILKLEKSGKNRNEFAVA